MLNFIKLICVICSLAGSILFAEPQVKNLKDDENTADAKIVTQKEKNFSVLEIEAVVGEPIIFLNLDTVVHNVFSATGSHVFNLGMGAPNSKKSVVFDKPGEVDVFCAIHPKMKLKIKVKDSKKTDPK